MATERLESYFQALVEANRDVARDLYRSVIFRTSEVPDSLLDSAAAIDGYTPREVLKLIGAVLAGAASGGPTGTVFKSLDGTADRVASTSTASGNRTSVTLTP